MTPLPAFRGYAPIYLWLNTGNPALAGCSYFPILEGAVGAETCQARERAGVSCGRLLTLAEAGRELGCSVSTVRRRIELATEAKAA